MGPPRELLIGLSSPYFGSTFGGGEKYLGAAAEAVRDGVAGSRVVIMGSVPADRAAYEARLGLDLSGIELESTNRRVTPVHRLLNGLVLLRPLRNRVLAAQAGRSTGRFDLHLAMAYRIPVHSRARRGAILCQFPYPTAEGVDEFQLVICYSEYVRTWVRRYWDRDALVVNPPIDRPTFEPDWAAKEHRILSVGRFFEGGHSKRHELLVTAFRDLCDAGLSGWRLDLAGSVHRDGPHAGYFARIEQLARGYPIELHPDLPAEGLARLYSRASLYWHAAGVGVADTDPDQREHFGMTVAEAMGYGAVPLVHDSGGLPEVVRNGVDGLSWKTLEELRELTSQLAGDAGRRNVMGLAARASSARFGRERFKQELVAALAPLIEELR